MNNKNKICNGCPFVASPQRSKVNNDSYCSHPEKQCPEELKDLYDWDAVYRTEPPAWCPRKAALERIKKTIAFEAELDNLVKNVKYED